MFISILVSAIFAVCPAIGIVLPNGFVFDEKPYLNYQPTVTDLVGQKCELPYNGCADDCSTSLTCDGNYNIVGSSRCFTSTSPYCVKNGNPDSLCSRNFPMSNTACLTKALNSFICTADGQFSDPTDCTKYHVCNGTSHSIVECPASHSYWYDDSILDPSVNPGNGEFSCRFKPINEACSCERFYCDGATNVFVYREMNEGTDRFHYAYCLEIGLFRATIVFKCPNGTVHDSEMHWTNFVNCYPLLAATAMP